jgi:HEPN domain-containing protein
MERTEDQVAVPTNRREWIGLWPEMAFQSYVLARVAKRCGYWYSAAKAAHFAVELMLKYLLVLPKPWAPVPPWPSRAQPRTPDKLRTHDLTKLWRWLDNDYPGNDLSEHAGFVEELNRWEGIRYGQLSETGPTAFTTTMEDAEQTRAANVGNQTDVFALDLARLDELFRALPDLAGISWRLQGSKFMVAEGREFYEENNPFAIR